MLARLRLIGLTLLAAALSGALCWSLYRREAAGIESRLRERESVRVGLLAHFVRTDLQVAVNDLPILADGDGLQAFLQHGESAALARAVRQAVLISRLRGDYDHVRFLDESGRVVVHAERGGAVVSSDRLQDNSDLPYFRKTSTLGPGEIYVSAFDLDVEKGTLEEPFKPTVRFATPVFDATGRRRGVYVINYLVGGLVSHLEQSAVQYAQRLRLLNSQGYWLKAETSNEEWGFQLPGRSAFTLARSEPDLWKRMARDPEGQEPRDGGLLTWARVVPRDFSQGEPNRIVAEHEFLIVASQVSAAELTAIFTALNQTFAVLTPALLALVVAGAWSLDARRQSLVSLRRSQESLAVTLHSIGDAVLATDREGRVTLMNPVAETLTAWTQADARGRPVAEVFRIIDEGTREPTRIPVAEVLVTGEVRGLANHSLLVARDATEIPISDSAAPIRDDDGTILGVVLVFRDVTAERSAEQALRESEARYRTLFNSIDEGFCIIEMIFDGQGLPVDYRFLEISPSFEKQTGLRDACGKRMRELAPAHEEHWFEIYGRVAMTGEAIRFENRAEQLHRSFDVYAFRFGDPARRQVAILFSDITERRRAQAELDRFFSLSVDFLAIAGADGYFKRVSAAVEHTLGWTAEEFRARPFLDFVHPDDHAATRRDIERQVTAGEKVHFENRYRHKDGSWRVLSWRSVPYQDLMYATARDVTQDKRHDEQIQQLNADLQRHAVKLEAANKELESFSYSVAHDLLAPLRHVQGFVEMLTDEVKGRLSENAQHYLTVITQASVEMGQLIEDLLTFPRMGRADLRETQVPLDALIHDTVRDLEPETSGRNIDWTIAPLPQVIGDPVMIKQVLVNLLGNAVKYSRRRDRAAIEIGCAGHEDGRCVFFVRDNGAGFDMAYARRLFGVFQRLHRSDEFEGTGIGLANVHRIITRHGGRVWAEGKVDGGATFYFTLRPATSGDGFQTA